MNINSPDVPETLRLCRGCKTAHYWDKATNKRVDEKTLPQHSFVEEALCLRFKFPGTVKDRRRKR